MIRVCYIVDAPYAGGAERYVSFLAKGLDRARFEVTVLYKKGEDLERWADELEREGVATRSMDMNIRSSPGDFFRVASYLRRLRPHIVHVNMPGPYDAQMGLLIPAARLAGVPRVVSTEHLPMVPPLWKRALLRRTAYRWVDAVVTVCRANVPYLREFHKVPGEKITIVHNALPFSYGVSARKARREMRERLSLDDGTIALAVVGSLIKRKGHDLLFTALESLKDEPWRLFVVGDGEERAAYEQAVKDKALSGKVVFTGSLPAREVERVLSAVDVLIIPSRVEAFPYVLLEAMASSLPVVATRVYGIPEAALDRLTALLIEPGDVEGLAAAVLRLMHDRGLRRAMGGEARKRFEEEFTLEKHLSRMERLYIEALHGESSRIDES